MNQIIPFPLKKPETLALQLVPPPPEPVMVESSQYVAKLAARAASSAAAALLDLSLCAQDVHNGEPFHISTETVTSLVEALRLSILATGCRNQDRTLITALCAWSEAVKSGDPE